MGQWSRRHFLRGTATGLGMAVIPSFLMKSGQVFAAPGPGAPLTTSAQDLGSTYFATHFGVSKTTVDQAMRVALSKGGEFADLFFQHQTSSFMRLEDGDVNQAFTSVDLGVGVRVVIGDQTGFAFTEELTTD